MKNEITIMLPSKKSDEHQMLPTLGLHLTPFKVKKEKLAESLTELINDVNEIIRLAQTKTNSAQLESISIAAEVSAEGGISWIGQANAGYSNAITLTFRVSQKLKKIKAG